MLDALLFDQAGGKLAHKNRRIADLPHDMGDTADMVEMSMGDYDALDPIRLVAQIGDVGNDIVDTGHVFLGKLQTHVDDDYFLVIFDHGHIPPDLLQAA